MADSTSEAKRYMMNLEHFVIPDSKKAAKESYQRVESKRLRNKF